MLLYTFRQYQSLKSSIDFIGFCNIKLVTYDKEIHFLLNKCKATLTKNMQEMEREWRGNAE